MAASGDKRKQRVFTHDQVVSMRQAADSLRPSEGYSPGRWMVSALNRDSSIVEANFPSKPKVRDITLRTIEQMGIVRSAPERRQLLTALAVAGVDEVMISAFRRGLQVEELQADVEAVRAVNSDCLLFLGSANTEADIQLAHQAGIGAVQVWMGPFLGGATPAIAGAVYKRAWEGRAWDDLRFPKSAADQVSRVLRLTELSSKYGIKLSCSVLILSYATLDYIVDFCEQVSKAGAFDVMLGDHSSALTPEAWTGMCRAIKQKVPECSISVHPHDMFGLATACALAGFKGGASTAEVSVNGLTEGPPQADLAHVIASLKILYGVDTNVDLEKLTGIARVAENLTGVESPSNRGITGTRVFDLVSSDEYVQETKVDPLFHCALVPDVVGNRSNIAIAIGTGPYSVWDKLEEMGFHSLQKAQVAAVFDAVKSTVRKLGRRMEDDEFKRIAMQVLHIENARHP